MKETHEHAKKRGKKSRVDGAAFELRVRKDLTEKGFVVDKFGLNVEFDKIDKFIPVKKIISIPNNKNIKIPTLKEIIPRIPIPDRIILKGKLVQAKNKWAGPNRPMMMGAGFPDFVCFKSMITSWADAPAYYEVIGVECKCNGILTKQEKEKCKWLLDNNIFSKILIAEKTKVKNRVVIIYHDFEEKYGHNN